MNLITITIILIILKKNNIFAYENFLYKNADLVIGNAEKLSSDLKKVTKCKVKTIYNPAYDEELYKLSKSKIKKINKKT